jgi:hypothetical protein
MENYVDQAKFMYGEDCFWVMAIDTHDYFIIDVDDPEYQYTVESLLTDHPYYLSSTKKLPKIFVRDPKMAFGIPEENVKLFGGKVEIQKGLWSYMDFSATIENNDKEIPELNTIQWFNEFEDVVYTKDEMATLPREPVLESVPLSFINQHYLFKLCQCLNPERFNNRNQWFMVAIALKSDPFYYNYHIWKYFSSTSDKYDEKNYIEGGTDWTTWNSIKNKNTGITVGSLHYWAKQDNQSLYDQFFSKSYDSIKLRTETILFKIKSPVCFCVLNEDNFDILNKDKCVLRFMEETYLSEETDKKTGEKLKVQKSFMLRWLFDPNKRCYDKMVFNPSPIVNPNHYNLYKGMKADELVNCEYKQEHVDAINKFILERLCGGDEKAFEFFNWWVAHVVRKPYEKTRVCIVIKSTQGIGKNLYLNFLGNKIIGENYYKSVAQSGKCLGRFNGILCNVILLNLNEIEQKDTKDVEGSIKSFITDDKISIERKNVDPLMIDNHLNIIATTNKSCPFYVEHSDRRFACFESDAPALNNDEIQYYLELFNNNDVAFSYYKYLLERVVLPNEMLEKVRPMSPFYRECKIVSATPITMFWKHYLHCCPKEKHNMTFESLYNLYKQWIQVYHNTREPPTYKMFCINIVKYPANCLKVGLIRPERLKGVEINPIDFRAYLQHIEIDDKENELEELPLNPLS